MKKKTRLRVTPERCPVYIVVCDFTEPRMSMESTGDDLADWRL